MKQMPFSNQMLFNNILYIGDEPKQCLSVIEKFNSRLLEIENSYQDWFSSRNEQYKFAEHDRLHYHIHYHFEGGIAVFKFRDEEVLPASIRNECVIACRNLAAEHMFYSS